MTRNLPQAGGLDLEERAALHHPPPDDEPQRVPQRSDAPDLAEVVNTLMDLERACELRCAEAAAHAGSPQLRATLDLCAAEHGADALRLHEAVVACRGTPHAGDTTAILADPSAPNPLERGHGDDDRLEACIEAEAALAERLDAAARSHGMPHEAVRLLNGCADAARARHRRLADWRRPAVAAPASR